MLDNIDAVEKFYKYINNSKNVGMRERDIALSLGLFNLRESPSVGLLRLCYSFAICRLVSAGRIDFTGNKNDMQQFEDAMMVAERIKDEIVENGSFDPASWYGKLYSRTTVDRALMIYQFDGYLKRNGYRFVA